MSDKRPAIDAGSFDDLIDRLSGEQYRCRHASNWLFGIALACLVAGLSLTGPASHLAYCLTFIATAGWLRAAMDFSGRYWFVHSTWLHEVIRPRPNLTAELAAAILAVEEALQTPRSSEETTAPPPEEGDSAESRHSAASSALEGHP